MGKKELKCKFIYLSKFLNYNTYIFHVRLKLLNLCFPIYHLNISVYQALPMSVVLFSFKSITWQKKLTVELMSLV